MKVVPPPALPSLAPAPPRPAAATAAADRARQLLWGGWTLYGLLLAALAQAAGGTMGASAGLAYELAYALAPAWLWAALTPVVVWATRRLAPARPGWVRTVAAHIGLALAIGLALSAGRAAVNAAWDVGGTTAWRAFAREFAFWLDHNCFAYAVIVGVTSALDLHRAWIARARRDLALQAELARARLRYLRRQLQPHFLFNCLNATAELTREEPEVAQRMLRHLQRLLRAAFGGRDTEEVALRDELAILEPYVELQRMRFGHALRVAHEVPPEVLDARVPAFVLQPLVENAIQHGLAARPGGGTVTVIAAVADGRLHLTVHDDGPGPVRAPGRGRRGIGMRNTRDRLAELYGEDHQFTLRHEPGAGTFATLDLPLRGVRGAPPASGPGAFATLAAAAHAAARATPAGAAAPAQASGDFAAREEAATFATGEMLAAVRPPRFAPRTWLTLAVAWLAIGGLWIVQNLLRQLVAWGELRDLPSATIDFWTAIAWMGLSVPVVLLARRVRLTRRGWKRALAVHLGAALLVDVAHLVLLLRFLAVVGLLDRPLLHPGNVSQFVLNLVIYAGLVTWSHVRDFAGWHRERALASARLDAQLAQARWQALALELRPEFLLMLLERVAKLAPADPARAERLVERLADLLRTTLDTVGHETQPLKAELAQLEEWLALWGEATEHEVTLDVLLPDTALARPVSAGAFRALTNLLLAHDPPPGARVALTVEAEPRDGRLALRVRSSLPLRPMTDGFVSGVVPSWTGASFPDSRTAELDLGPAAPVLTHASR